MKYNCRKSPVGSAIKFDGAWLQIVTAEPTGKSFLGSEEYELTTRPCTQLEKVKGMVDRFDWWYMMSGDGRVYAAGERSKKALDAQLKLAGPEALAYYEDKSPYECPQP